MSKILCSTGALLGKPNNRNIRLLESISKELNCDGFEFMMYSSWYDKVDEIIEELQSMNLYIPVMHCEKHIGETISRGEKTDIEDALRYFTINCDIAKAIKADKMVIHLWGGLISDNYFYNNLNAYKLLLDISNGYDIDLLVENVVCNNENPMKHWCELVKYYPNIHFVFDTKMASFHNQLDLLYQKEYDFLWKNGHIKHYHINDYAGEYMEWSKLKTLPIGKGHIDFEEFFSFIKKIEYNNTFTVEATAFNSDGSIDTDMLNSCFTYIREILE